MKKLFVYTLLMTFVIINVFGSCEENVEKRNKLIKQSKKYFTEYRICDKIDSSYTNISVYTGEIDGHKYRYHLFEGKNKSQMEVEHLYNECKKCKSIKKQ